MFNMSTMNENEKGLSTFLIPFGVSTFLLIVFIIFSVWAFSGRQDYKNNTDKKIANAVYLAKQVTQASDAQVYAQDSKQPYKTYIGPQAFGTLTIQYPRTWSAYVVEQDTSGTPINGYFEPNIVTDVTSPTSVYALRVEVTSQSYTQTVSQFTSLQTAGKVTISPFSIAARPSIVGVRVDGQIETTETGSMVILPLRNETIQLWTESSQYESDFSNILSTFTFSP